MKRHVIHYSLFVISLCAPAYAQIAQRWISEASRPTAQEITIYRVVVEHTRRARHGHRSAPRRVVARLRLRC